MCSLVDECNIFKEHAACLQCRRIRSKYDAEMIRGQKFVWLCRWVVWKMDSNNHGRKEKHRAQFEPIGTVKQEIWRPGYQMALNYVLI
jgi:hypothetical protein